MLIPGNETNRILFSLVFRFLKQCIFILLDLSLLIYMMLISYLSNPVHPVILSKKNNFALIVNSPGGNK